MLYTACYLLVLIHAFFGLACFSLLGGSGDTSIVNQTEALPTPVHNFRKATKVDVKPTDAEIRLAKERPVEAVFHSNSLWVLGGNGVLLQVDLENGKANPFEFSEVVADIFVNQKNEFYLLTSEKSNSTRWKILKKEGNDWLEISDLEVTFSTKGKKEPATEIVGLAEYQNRFIVLTNDAVYLQEKENNWRKLKLIEKLRTGLQTPFAATDDGFIYYGLNHGEWGGGLWRINLKSGNVKVIEKKTVGDICFRPLDAGCDPITSIIKDYQDPNSIFAGVGLRHMSQHGSVVKVNAKDVSVIFNKTYKYDVDARETIPTNPCDAQNETGNLSDYKTEGVFGMQAGNNGLWIVTGRAVYQLVDGKIESCSQMPKKFANVDGILLSEDIPRVILIGTNVNWAKSLSGTTPLIALKN